MTNKVLVPCRTVDSSIHNPSVGNDEPLPVSHRRPWAYRNKTVVLSRLAASFVVILLLCLMLYHKSNAFTLAAEPELPVAANTQQTTSNDKLQPPTALNEAPVITYENGLFTVFDTQGDEHAFIRQQHGIFKALEEHSGILTISPDGNYRWNNIAVVTLLNSDFTDTIRNTNTTSGDTTAISSGPNNSDYALTNFECQALPPDGITGSPVDVIPQEDTPDDTNSEEAPQDTEQAVDDPTDESDQDPIQNPDQDPAEDPAQGPAPDPNQDPAQDPTQDPTQDPAQDPAQDSTQDTTQDTTENPAQDQQAEQCDTTSDGPYSFQNSLNTGEHITVDARPASCQSYFVEYYGTERGFEIEAGLQLHAPYQQMQATLRTFPVIDFIDESNWFVVNSRDLGSSTYNSPNKPDALYAQLIDDAEEIQHNFIDVLEEQGSITASELGQSTTITLDQRRPVTLQLIIRDGIASPSHWEQISRARQEMMQRFGITLEVVVIP